MSTGPAKFSLGHVVATPAGLRFCGLHGIDLHELLARHQKGDYGEMSPDDLLANDVALVDGSRIFSSYTFPQGKVWIITDAKDDEGNRASTCLMLPDDY